MNAPGQVNEERHKQYIAAFGEVAPGTYGRYTLVAAKLNVTPAAALLWFKRYADKYKIK